MDKPLDEARMRSFGGMASNIDPNDLAPERATLQVNITTSRKGELVIRRGLREVSFDDEGV